MPDRCAIVTGGAGFIGSHVVDALLAEEWRVVVVDDLSAGEVRRVAAEATLEVVDITDRGALDAVIDAARPAAIFHLAAQASVTRSVADPERDCEINVRGTLNVLDAATRHRAPVVFTSTGGALYGDRAPLPTPEDVPPAPISPYGASKWAAEAYVTTWREATGIPHAVCRLANVYGPRQNPHGEAGVVAVFSHCLWRGDRPRCTGSGSRPAITCMSTTSRRRCSQRGEGRGHSTFRRASRPPSPACSNCCEPRLARPSKASWRHCGPASWSAAASTRAVPTTARLGAGTGAEEGLATTYRALAAELELDELPGWLKGRRIGVQ